jgi:ATP phosphoribosyltransferase regulatory subunit
MKKTLPSGFYDLLFDEAEKNHHSINLLIDIFLQNGFRLIKTPLVEFAEGYVCEREQNLFQTIDVISGEIIVFRNDITKQISRLINGRLKDYSFPLKLCYVGDVLCAKSNILYQDRQQTQVGIEFIGSNDLESSFTIIKTILGGIEKLSVKNLLISFSLPDFFDVFCEEMKIENKENLKNFILNKNISLIKKNYPNFSEIIIEIVLQSQSLEVLENFLLSKKIISKKIQKELEKAKKIFYFIENNFPQIEICFDLFGDSCSSDYNNFVFDVFVKNFSYSIAKGGSYKIIKINEDGTENKTNAVGATIYVNNLRKISS